MKSVFSLIFCMFCAAAIALACNPTSSAPADPHASQDPTRCADCHTPEFQSTTKPPHPNARPNSCGVCHTQSSWHPWRVDHPWYALNGAHLKAAQDEALEGKENQVKCFWCHRGDARTFKDTKTDCISCHADDRATSKFPGHETFQPTCQDCHSTDAWKPAKKPQMANVEVSQEAIDAGVSSPQTKMPPHAPKTTKPRATATVVATPTQPPPSATSVPTTLPTTMPDVTSRASRHH